MQPLNTQNSRQALEQRLQEREERVKELKAQVHDLQARLETLVLQSLCADHLSDKIKSLEAQNISLKDELKTFRKRTKVIPIREYEAQKKTLSEVQTLLSAKEKELADLQARCKAMEAACADQSFGLNKMLEEAKQQVALKKTENETLRQQIKRDSVLLAEDAQKLSIATREIEAQRTAFERLQKRARKDADDLQRHKEINESKYAIALKKNDGLADELAALYRQHDHLCQAYEVLEKTHGFCSERMQTIQDEYDAAHMAYLELTKQHQTAQTEIANLKDLIQQLNAKNEAHLRDANHLNEIATQQFNRAEALALELAELKAARQADAAQAKKRAFELEQEVDTLRAMNKKRGALPAKK